MDVGTSAAGGLVWVVVVVVAGAWDSGASGSVGLAA